MVTGNGVVGTRVNQVGAHSTHITAPLHLQHQRSGTRPAFLEAVNPFKKKSWKGRGADVLKLAVSGNVKEERQGSSDSVMDTGNHGGYVVQTIVGDVYQKRERNEAGACLLLGAFLDGRHHKPLCECTWKNKVLTEDNILHMGEEEILDLIRQPFQQGGLSDGQRKELIDLLQQKNKGLLKKTELWLRDQLDAYKRDKGDAAYAELLLETGAQKVKESEEEPEEIDMGEDGPMEPKPDIKDRNADENTEIFYKGAKSYADVTNNPTAMLEHRLQSYENLYNGGRPYKINDIEGFIADGEESPVKTIDLRATIKYMEKHIETLEGPKKSAWRAKKGILEGRLETYKGKICEKITRRLDDFEVFSYKYTTRQALETAADDHILPGNCVEAEELGLYHEICQERIRQLEEAIRGRHPRRQGEEDDAYGIRIEKILDEDRDLKKWRLVKGRLDCRIRDVKDRFLRALGEVFRDKKNLAFMRGEEVEGVNLVRSIEKAIDFMLRINMEIGDQTDDGQKGKKAAIICFFIETYTKKQEAILEREGAPEEISFQLETIFNQLKAILSPIPQAQRLDKLHELLCARKREPNGFTYFDRILLGNTGNLGLINPDNTGQGDPLRKIFMAIEQTEAVERVRENPLTVGRIQAVITAHPEIAVEFLSMESTKDHPDLKEMLWNLYQGADDADKQNLQAYLAHVTGTSREKVRDNVEAAIKGLKGEERRLFCEEATHIWERIVSARPNVLATEGIRSKFTTYLAREAARAHFEWRFTQNRLEDYRANNEILDQEQSKVSKLLGRESGKKDLRIMEAYALFHHHRQDLYHTALVGGDVRGVQPKINPLGEGPDAVGYPEGAWIFSKPLTERDNALVKELEEAGVPNPRGEWTVFQKMRILKYNLRGVAGLDVLQYVNKQTKENRTRVERMIDDPQTTASMYTYGQVRQIREELGAQIVDNGDIRRLQEEITGLERQIVDLSGIKYAKSLRQGISPEDWMAKSKLLQQVSVSEGLSFDRMNPFACRQLAIRVKESNIGYATPEERTKLGNALEKLADLREKEGQLEKCMQDVLDLNHATTKEKIKNKLSFFKDLDEGTRNSLKQGNERLLVLSDEMASLVAKKKKYKNTLGDLINRVPSETEQELDTQIAKVGEEIEKIQIQQRNMLGKDNYKNLRDVLDYMTLSCWAPLEFMAAKGTGDKTGAIKLVPGFQPSSKSKQEEFSKLFNDVFSGQEARDIWNLCTFDRLRLMHMEPVDYVQSRYKEMGLRAVPKTRLADNILKAGLETRKLISQQMRMNDNYTGTHAQGGSVNLNFTPSLGVSGNLGITITSDSMWIHSKVCDGYEDADLVGGKVSLTGGISLGHELNGIASAKVAGASLTASRAQYHGAYFTHNVSNDAERNAYAFSNLLLQANGLNPMDARVDKYAPVDIGLAKLKITKGDGAAWGGVQADVGVLKKGSLAADGHTEDVYDTENNQYATSKSGDTVKGGLLKKASLKPLTWKEGMSFKASAEFGASYTRRELEVESTQISKYRTAHTKTYYAGLGISASFAGISTVPFGGGVRGYASDLTSDNQEYWGYRRKTKGITRNLRRGGGAPLRGDIVHYLDKRAQTPPIRWRELTKQSNSLWMEKYIKSDSFKEQMRHDAHLKSFFDEVISRGLAKNQFVYSLNGWTVTERSVFNNLQVEGDQIANRLATQNISKDEAVELWRRLKEIDLQMKDFNDPKSFEKRKCAFVLSLIQQCVRTKTETVTMPLLVGSLDVTKSLTSVHMLRVGRWLIPRTTDHLHLEALGRVMDELPNLTHQQSAKKRQREEQAWRRAAFEAQASHEGTVVTDLLIPEGDEVYVV